MNEQSPITDRIINSVLYGDPRGYGYKHPTPKEKFYMEKEKDNKLQEILDLVKTKFIENSMRMDETHKTLIKILEVLTDLNHNMERIGEASLGYDKWHDENL